jgi:hypothetical protein
MSISDIASQFAAMIIRKRLEQGHMIQIPSLGFALGRYSSEAIGWCPPFVSGYDPHPIVLARSDGAPPQQE